MNIHVQGEKINLTVKISKNYNKLQVIWQRGKMAKKSDLEAMGRRLRAMKEAFGSDEEGLKDDGEVL